MARLCGVLTLPPAEYALPEAPRAEFMDIPKAFGAGIGEGTHGIGEGMQATGKQLVHNTVANPASGGLGALAGSVGLNELGGLLNSAGKSVGDYFTEHMSEGGKAVNQMPITEAAKNPLNIPQVAAKMFGQGVPVLAGTAVAGPEGVAALGFLQNEGMTHAAASQQAQAEISQLNDNQLMQSQTFVKLFQNIDKSPQYQSYSDLQKIDLAKAQLAETAAMGTLNNLPVLMANIASAYTGDAELGRIMTGDAMKWMEKSLPGILTKHMGKNAVINGGLMGLQQWAINNELNKLGVGQRDSMQGVKESSEEGAAGGALMAVVPAFVGHVRQRVGKGEAETQAKAGDGSDSEMQHNINEAVDDIQKGTQEITQGAQALKDEFQPEPDLFGKNPGDESATLSPRGKQGKGLRNQLHDAVISSGTAAKERKVRAPTAKRDAWGRDIPLEPQEARPGLTEQQQSAQRKLAEGFNDKEKFGGNRPDDFVDVPAYMRAGKTVHNDPRPFHIIDTAGPAGRVKARFDDPKDANIFGSADLLDYHTKAGTDSADPEFQAVKDWFYRMTRGVSREEADAAQKKANPSKDNPGTKAKPKQQSKVQAKQPRSDEEAQRVHDTIMGYWQFVKDAARDAKRDDYTAPSMEDFTRHLNPDPLLLRNNNVIYAGGEKYSEPLHDDEQQGFRPDFRAGQRVRGGLEGELLPRGEPQIYSALEHKVNTIPGELNVPLLESNNAIYARGPVPDEGQKGRPPQFERGKTKAQRRLDRFEERIGGRPQHPALTHRQLPSGEVAIPDSVADLAAAGNGEVYLRKNGKPFPNEGLARLSKPYTDAKKAGEQPKVVEVGGGYGVEVPKPEKVVKKQKADPDIEGSERRQTDKPQVQTNPKPEQSSQITTPQEHSDFFENLINHPEDVTPEDVKSALESTIANKEAVTTALNKLTKEKLRPYQGYHFDSSTRKDRMVATAYEALLNQYRWLTNEGDVMVTSGRQSNADRAREAVSNITQKDINGYAAAAQKSRAERKSRLEAQKAAIDNPQTMDDFRVFVKAKGRDALTTEQSERLDQLLADEQLKKQKEKAEAPRVTSGFSHDDELKINPIEQGKNSKTGETIYNVNLETRLGTDKFKDASVTARKLGGGYWRGNFWFPTEEKAQQFTNWLRGESVDHTADDAARWEAKQERRTERLTKSAERLQDDAEERLNADRKVNTAKRIREAAYATAGAERDLRDADLLRKIAEGKADGSVKYLTGLQHKTQLATLRQIANRLVYDIPHNERDDLTHTTWDGKREWNDNVPVSTRVKYARYPMLDWNPHSLTDLLPKMADVRGYKLAAGELRLSQVLENGLARLPAGRKVNDKLAAWLQTQPGSWPDYVSDYNRLQRAGITTRPIMRSALAELLRLDGETPTKVFPRLSKMEQDLRMKLAGNRNAFIDFFPTPESRADYFVEQADIQSGHDVLEPSAGNGVLADAARRAGANVDVVELASDLRDILAEKRHNIVGSDFDEFNPDKQYDRILMNPPFSGDLDIQHVRKAWELLKPGGRLAAIVSSMAGERQNKRNQAFREWLDGLGATEEQLPEGMFNESLNPTSVRTKLLILDKPATTSAKSKANDVETNFSRVPRTDWKDDFPDVVLHGRLGDATAHPDYKAAKGGDDAAARRLVADVMTRKSVDKLRDILDGRKAILAAVHAEEAVSRNAIPQAMADVLGKALGMEVDPHLLQSAKVGRTAQDGFGRLTNQPSFDGPVRTDLPYILLDDTLTQGGTLANLKGYIEDHGGTVMGTSTLTGKQYSAKIALAADTLRKLRDHFEGTELENWWSEQHGYGFDRLTESEANYLLRAANADKIRDRVLAARQDGAAFTQPESLRDNGSIPPDVNHKFSKNASELGGVSLSGRSADELSQQLRDTYPGLKLGLMGKGKLATLSRIVLPEAERNSGKGSEIMRRIVDWADANNKTLALSPSSDFGGNKNRLFDFYKRFGFKDNKGRDKDYEISESMYREPNHYRPSRSASHTGGVFVSGSPRERIRSGVADYQPRGVDKAKVEAEAARFLKKWKSAGGITVQVARDMAEAERLAGFALPEIHAVHLPNSNRVILVADHLDSLSHVRAKLRHEILGHHALSEVVGPAEYEKMLRTVAAGQHSKSLKPYFDRVLENYDGNDPWKQVEEVISHVLEDGERGLLGRAWERVSSAVLQVLRKSGFLSDENITAGEVRNMMRPISGRLKRVGPRSEYLAEEGDDGPASFSLAGKDGLLTKPRPGETETEATQRRAKVFGKELEKKISGIRNMSAKNLLEWIKVNGKTAGNTAAIHIWTNRQLADVYKDVMKTDYAGNYQGLQAKMEARRNRIMTSAERGIESQWGKLSKSEGSKLSDLMVDATMTRVHPDKPLAEQPRFQKLKNEQARLKSKAFAPGAEGELARYDAVTTDLDAMRENYADLNRRWKDLTPEAKDLWHDTEHWYKDSYEDLKQALIQRIQDVGGDQHAALISRVREQFERSLNDGPYFPLARFGKYVVIARKDGEYIREHFEDKMAALACANAYKKDGYTVAQTVKAKLNGTNSDSAHSFGKNILDLISKAEDGSLSKEALTDQVWQTMLELMPDSSYARHFIRRRRVKGASKDARRAFANSAFHFAHHISKIEYGHKMQAVLDDMGNEIDAAMKGEFLGVQPENLEVAQKLLDELKARHEMTMNPGGDGFSNALTGLGYTYNMAMNFSSAIINATQTALIALPQLASRYGWKNAVKALGSATVDYFRSSDKRFKWFGGDSSWLEKDAWMSMARSKHLSQDEVNLIRRLNEDGVISVTQASSLAQHSEAAKDRLHNRVLDNATLIGGQLFHNIEVANREVTALAVYRLAKEAGGGHLDPEIAYKIASKAVYDSHFDYNSSNRPRWMRQGWQKVLLQFKMYAQHMFYTFGRSAEKSLRGETPEIRKMARKEFMNYMLMHTLFAGVTGLPFAVQAIYWAGAKGIHSAISDDDGPWDPEIAMKNWLNDELGGFASTAIADGIFNAIGVDLHSRVGVDKLFFGFAPSSMEARDKANYYMNEALGPVVGGLGTSFVNGFTKMSNGDWIGGTQAVTPAILRNLIKTYGEATRGITTASGEEVVPADDFTGFELAMQSLGFSPSRIGQAYDARSAIKDVQGQLSDERSQLLQRYFSTVMNGENTDDIMEDIQLYNRKNPQNAITGEVITRSLRAKQKARLKKLRGLVLSRKDEHLRVLGRFGDAEPLL